MEARTQIIRRHETVKEMVLKLLKDYRELRNNDHALIEAVWVRQGAAIRTERGDLLIKKEMIALIYSSETIRRNRAHIQNKERRYLPTDPKVLIERRIKEEAIKAYYAPSSWVYEQWQTMKYQIK